MIAAAGALQAFELRHVQTLSGAAALSGTHLGIAFGAALISGIVAIRLVYRVLGRQRFSDFAFYCWPAGLLFLLYLALKGGGR